MKHLLVGTSGTSLTQYSRHIELESTDFGADWTPDLKKNGLLGGVNWRGTLSAMTWNLVTSWRIVTLAIEGRVSQFSRKGAQLVLVVACDRLKYNTDNAGDAALALL